MKFRNSIDSAFGKVRCDLYDKRKEIENKMIRENWRIDNKVVVEEIKGLAKSINTLIKIFNKNAKRENLNWIYIM